MFFISFYVCFYHLRFTTVDSRLIEDGQTYCTLSINDERIPSTRTISYSNTYSTGNRVLYVMFVVQARLKHSLDEESLFTILLSYKI